MMADDRVPLLIISGTVGAGKSTILTEIHELLSRAGVAHACVDADALSLSWPRRGNFNQTAVSENVASIWDNARRAGARRFVIAAVIERREDLDSYRDAVPRADTVVVQLTASYGVRVNRLRQREVGSGLEWHVARTAELQQILDEAALHDFTISNDARPAVEVAQDVLTRAGWA